MGAIPSSTVAALPLIEHHWAVPLLTAFARSGRFRIREGFGSRSTR